MQMGEIRFYSVQKALKGIRRLSKISHLWEILKIFMITHNVSPIWMRKSSKKAELIARESSQDKINSDHISFTHPSIFYHSYFWSRFPLPKEFSLNMAEFSFDIPSTFLFFLNPIAAVVLMKLFTYLGKKLGLDSHSEEPVLIPTR